MLPPQASSCLPFHLLLYGNDPMVIISMFQLLTSNTPCSSYAQFKTFFEIEMC